VTILDEPEFRRGLVLGLTLLVRARIKAVLAGPPTPEQTRALMREVGDQLIIQAREQEDAERG
jgi:hypothetical protein